MTDDKPWITREFPGHEGAVIELEQDRETFSRSVWEGYCRTCGQLNRRYTCYRCGVDIDVPGIRLNPPFGSLDARSENYLCDECMVAFQEWAGAPKQVVTNTRQAFLGHRASPPA